MAENTDESQTNQEPNQSESQQQPQQQPQPSINNNTSNDDDTKQDPNNNNNNISVDNDDQSNISTNNNNNDNNNNEITQTTTNNNNNNDNNEVSSDNKSTTKQDDNNNIINQGHSIEAVDALIQKLTSLSPQNKAKNKGKKQEKKPSIGITAKNISNVCNICRQYLMTQSMLIEVQGPLKIVGDIHGQFYDLLRLFDLGGYPPECNYLFLGDYIDRGKHSLESIVLLFCFKIKYWKSFYLLRGNHECASINRIYGFYDECKRRFPKHGVKLWKIFTECFNCLPIACLIDEKIFCMHGGLSPDLRSMDQIRKIQRPTDVPDSGLICDLLWSDPEPGILGWGENDRGVSWTFGPNVLKKFLNKFDMDLICRAHQVVEDGYEFFGQRRLVTIFSAPNYCGEFDNAGALMSVDETLMCSFHIIKPNYKKRTRFYN